MQREDPAATAFSVQAPLFDRLNASNAISQYLRALFRQEVEAHLSPVSRILELNCGTGLDAMHFASLGHHVLATDLSEGMLAAFRHKLADSSLKDRVTIRQMDFARIGELRGESFDYIVSNFGGLNCSPDLSAVLRQLPILLRPGGKVTMMIMPRYTPWEWILALKGKFRTAFRRLSGSAPARVEGHPFTCYYYDPSYVIKVTREAFRVKTLRGVCVTVPPEFYENFGERYPRAFRVLQRIDRALANRFPFNRCGDHFLVTLEKK